MTSFDNIIIGAGPGGYELASELAARGESVLLVERDELGGTCLNRGCIPTKCLAASASAMLEAGSMADLGVVAEGVKVDFARITQRATEVVHHLREGIEAMLGKCSIVKGTASFTGQKTIEVNGEEYTAGRIVIATGSRPASLGIPGAEFAINSDEALWLNELPSSIVIIGGGVIGMEFASIFAALGSEVTVIEFCKEIIPAIDPEIAKRLRSMLSRRGINIVVGAAVESIEQAGGALRVTYQGKKGSVSVEAEKVVMAVGRRPVVPSGFEGKLTPRGYIEVDDAMQTSIPGVYAIGDVNGLLQLAHAAYAQGRTVLNPVLKFSSALVPSVVFTAPEVASVGPLPAELDAQGIKYHVVKRQYASNGKACADGHSEGVLKMLVADEDNAVLAVTILGHHAADLIAEATVLVTERIHVEDIPSRFVHAHPTLSELFV